MPACASCGQENPDGFQFCGRCGAPLERAAPAREQRKTVTVLFCDMSGSTALGERLDPEALRRTMARYFEEIRAVVERHGGTVEKFIGDAAMAVFGIPVSHEDDALRAVRAASEIRDRITQLGEDRSVALSFRTGVNTGEVVTGEGETLATGDAVNVAARLEQAAAPGEILIGADTFSLVRDAVSVEHVAPLDLKGKREPVPAYRLLGVDLAAPAFARHLDAPLVGRRRELARLRTDFEDGVERRACHLFTLLGPAGVGKSRLVAEFLAGVEDTADVLRGRCLSYGDDITYWPLVEILIGIGVDPSSVIGTSPAETQLAFRKLLEERARDRPQIVVLDDSQWAEGVFLDLIEHIADWSRDAPLLLLCVARPELLELREGWGGGKLNATTILLDALPAEHSAELLARLAGGVELEPGVRRQILEAADGNPLFLEEMVAMVGEDDGGEIVVPPTIHALLQARLDRLRIEERDVIGRGAVEGQVFHRGAVQELSAAAMGDVSAELLSLVRKEMIRPEQPTFPDDEAFRFRHLLIRDAAYESLSKDTRAELHEQFATWLERHGDLVELDEIVGYHLEQAYRNRAQLDPADTRLEALGRRTAERLDAAGKGALARGDLGAARGLLGRAAAMLPVGDPQRLRTLVDLVPALTQAGELDTSREIAAELHATPDPRYQALGDVVSCRVDFYAGTHRREDTQARMAAARAVFEALDEQLGLAYVAWNEGATSWSALRAEETHEAYLRGVEHARKAGAGWLVEEMHRFAMYPLSFGPTPAAEELRLTELALSRAEQGPLAEAATRRRYARLLAMQGRFEQAREQLRAGVAIAREAGLLVEAAAGGTMSAVFIETRAGDLDAAEQSARAGMEELDRLGDRAFYATVVLGLAEVLLRREHDEEAASSVRLVRETSGPDDVTNLIGADAIEGVLLARRGGVAEGESLARAAAELIETTDFYYHRGFVHELLAQTLALTGKRDEALAAAEKALGIYEAKGDEPAAGWARELVDSVSSEAP